MRIRLGERASNGGWVPLAAAAVPVPLVHQDETFATFKLARSAPLRWQRHIAVLKIVAGRTAVAMENARARSRVFC